MFGLIKQVLLSFSTSLAIKCVPLNNKTCMIRLDLSNLNSFELNYYPFAISLGKCGGIVILLITYLLKHKFRIKQKT